METLSDVLVSPNPSSFVLCASHKLYRNKRNVSNVSLFGSYCQSLFIGIDLIAEQKVIDIDSVCSQALS